MAIAESICIFTLDSTVSFMAILLEKIIAFHKIDNIHEIWPNLQVYVHGGVSFDPYRKGFEKLLV